MAKLYLDELRGHFDYFEDRELGLKIGGTENGLKFYNKAIIYMDNEKILISSKEDQEQINAFNIEINNIKSWNRDMCGGLQTILIIAKDGCYIQIYNRDKNKNDKK